MCRNPLLKYARSISLRYFDVVRTFVVINVELVLFMYICAENVCMGIINKIKHT